MGRWFSWNSIAKIGMQVHNAMKMIFEFHFGEDLCDPDEAATKFDDLQGAASDRNVRALLSAMHSSAGAWGLDDGISRARFGLFSACWSVCSLYCVLTFGLGKCLMPSPYRRVEISLHAYDKFASADVQNLVHCHKSCLDVVRARSNKLQITIAERETSAEDDRWRGGLESTIFVR